MSEISLAAWYRFTRCVSRLEIYINGHFGTGHDHFCISPIPEKISVEVKRFCPIPENISFL